MAIKSGESYSMVCCRKRGIFGPQVLEDNDENFVTVNLERQNEIMQRKFVPALRRKRGTDINNGVLQQYGELLNCLNRTL